MSVESQINHAFVHYSQDCYVGLKGGKVVVFPGRLVLKAHMNRHDGDQDAEASGGGGGDIGGCVDFGGIHLVYILFLGEGPAFLSRLVMSLRPGR